MVSINDSYVNKLKNIDLNKIKNFKPQSAEKTLTKDPIGQAEKFNNQFQDFATAQSNYNKPIVSKEKSKPAGMPRALIDKYALQDGYTPCNTYIDGHHIIYTRGDSDIDEFGHVLPKVRVLKPQI